jgi:hypothetical protein
MSKRAVGGSFVLTIAAFCLAIVTRDVTSPSELSSTRSADTATTVADHARYFINQQHAEVQISRMEEAAREFTRMHEHHKRAADSQELAHSSRTEDRPQPEPQGPTVALEAHAPWRSHAIHYDINKDAKIIHQKRDLEAQRKDLLVHTLV